MANQNADLDAAFHSLANPARRAVVGRLANGPLSVGELAKPLAMGLPSFLKHLRILEDDGLVISEKVGRVRTCRVNTPKLRAAEAWLNEQRRVWQSSTDRLADYVENSMKGNQDDD